jgi:hypothetical protein
MSSSEITSTLASPKQTPMELAAIEVGEIDLTELDLLADLDPGMIAWGTR